MGGEAGGWWAMAVMHGLGPAGGLGRILRLYMLLAVGNQVQLAPNTRQKAIGCKPAAANQQLPACLQKSTQCCGWCRPCRGMTPCEWLDMSGGMVAGSLMVPSQVRNREAESEHIHVCKSRSMATTTASGRSPCGQR